MVENSLEDRGGNDKDLAKLTVGGEGKKKDDTDKGSNLVGRINNLISTDLENITEGRDFLFVFIDAPLEVALRIGFLYTILGWR